ncbi:MAG TPA: hypothetical protein VK874_12425 [Gaiellaceae bacterium]|nr:hypothetical protein [Gaiellaceae bacterium]
MTLRRPAGVLLAWTAFVVLVQRWPSWEEGIRVEFAADAQFYELIARAAPGLPDTDVLRAYAQRFPAHWLVGVLHDITGIGLHALYRAATAVCVALALLALHRALTSLELDLRGHALALGAFAASAYPVHYLLAAPGMLSDAVFVLGLSVLLLGFVRGRLAVAVLGIAVAALGRQTALPVAAAAGVWAAFHPAWRDRRGIAVAALVAVPAGLYVALHILSDPFSQPRDAGVDDLTVLGFLTSARDFGEHVGLVVLGIAVPAALVAGAWIRRGGPPPWGPLLVAAAVVAQPLLLGPLANASNEPRLAGLAAPALALAAGTLLSGAVLGRGETVVCAAAIAVGGLHHRYTIAGPAPNVGWAVVELAAALLVLLVLARPALVREPRPAGVRRT